MILDKNTEGRVHNGQLEHFDETLKWKDKKDKTTHSNIDEVKTIYQHKDWLWSNFFMVQSDTNNLKGTKTVDYILKPDSKDYDPYKLFDYSPNTHHYIPNIDLPDTDRKRIQDMIDILGLNFPNVQNKRKQVVERAVRFPLVEENEFPTAIQFYKSNM